MAVHFRELPLVFPPPPATPAAVPSVSDRWLVHEGLRYCYRVLPHPRPAFEPTLFLSGAFQTMDSWARFARAFSPLTTVVLVDPPGMGRSDLLPQEFGIDYLAHTVRQLIDHLALDRINIVAASYGTPAAFRLAQLYPHRIARLALAGTMRAVPAHVREQVRETTVSALRGERDRLAQQVVDGLLCRDPNLPIARRHLAERVLRAGLTRMTDSELRKYATNTARLLDHPGLDLRHSISGLKALVFTGEHDVFTTPAACREVAAAFEDAVFTTIAEADHLFHIEQFDAVCTLLLSFMQDLRIRLR